MSICTYSIHIPYQLTALNIKEPVTGPILYLMTQLNVALEISELACDRMVLETEDWGVSKTTSTSTFVNLVND